MGKLINSEHNQANPDATVDARIEDALRSLPLAEPPAGLFLSVMAQVKTRQAVEKPVFRLNWLDFALSLFFASMLGLAMLIGGLLPLQVRINLVWQFHWLQAMHFDWIFWPALGLSLAACAAAGVIFARSLINNPGR